VIYLILSSLLIDKNLIMKFKNLLLIAVVAIITVSCSKEKLKPNYVKTAKAFNLNKLNVCADGNYEDYYNVASGVTQYTVKPIVIDPACNCIVSGYVKYVKNGKTVALVDYGKGTCDKWAVKTICANGDCKDKNASSCKFEQVCGAVK